MYGSALNADSIEDRPSISRRVRHCPARHPIRATTAGTVVGDEPDAQFRDNTDRPGDTKATLGCAMK
jgi:hypothetical protein